VVRHDQLHGREVWAVTASPHQAEVLFAGTGGHGLFRSVNGGGSWRPMSRGLESAYVRGLAVDPHDAERVYAAADPAAWYTSRDGGETWSCITDAATFDGAATVVALAVLTHDALVFLLATPAGLWRSVDVGQTWLRAAVPAAVHQLAALGPSGHVFAATHEGLYQSADAGVTWTSCLAGACKAVTAAPNGAWLAAAVTQPGAEATAIVVSRNAGATWSPLAAGPESVTGLAAGDAVLLAIDHAGGLWYTGGANDSSLPAAPWQAVADDLPPAFAVYVIAD
jgi:photosystem II stability/assembly factor-like uncharacterized protein